MNSEYVAMGIDPGVRVTGYAVLLKNGRDVTIRAGGIIRPNIKQNFSLRIYNIFSNIRELIRTYNANEIAIERLFTVYSHPGTAIQMAHARGAVLCAAGEAGIKVVSIAATHIKKAITGNGRASKEQMQKAMMIRLKLKEIPEPADLSDALAIAYCRILETL